MSKDEEFDADTLNSVLDQLDLDNSTNTKHASTAGAAGHSIGESNSVDEQESEEEEKSPAELRRLALKKLRYIRIPLPHKRFKRMNMKEIADVIRVQLMQLQTKNPMDDDFYFQVYSARKGEPWRGVGFPGENVSGMPKTNVHRYEDGTPKLPEGTLGRIASSSVRKPRKLVDFSPQDAEGGEEDLEESQTMFASFSVLFLIEEGIRCLMQIEDIDGLIQSQEESQELEKQRKTLGNNLLEHMGIFENNFMTLNPNHLLYKFASIPKGRVLILRSLLLLPAHLSIRVLCVLIGNLVYFCAPQIVSKLDSRASEAICEVLKNSSPEQITSLFDKHFFTRDNLQNMHAIIKSKTGGKLCGLFFRAGHSLRQNPSTPRNILLAWMRCFTSILSAVGGYPSFLFVATESDSSAEMRKLSASEKLRWETVLHFVLHANAEQLSIIRQDKLLETATRDSMNRVEAAQAVSQRLYSSFQ